MVFEPNRVRIKDFSVTSNKPKLKYLEKAITGSGTFQSGDMLSGFEAKVRSFKNNYDPGQANFMSQMDHELLRLRNDINSEYLSLNNKLHKLKFEAQRTLMRKDAEQRDYDKLVDSTKYKSIYST